MELQTNTGFGFPNKYHQKGDKQPSLKGKVNIEGVEYEFAMWPPKEGKKSFFFKFTKPEGESSNQESCKTEDVKPRPIQNTKPNTNNLFKKR